MMQAKIDAVRERVAELTKLVDPQDHADGICCGVNLSSKECNCGADERAARVTSLDFEINALLNGLEELVDQRGDQET